jgi:CRISPR/Cas system-associated endonuclease Cas1
MSNQRLKTMLSELERQAFSRQKVQKIQPIELKPVVMLDANDEPLAQEFLQAKGDKGQYTVLEDVAAWLEKQKRFADALKLWERARAYWQARLNEAKNSLDWHRSFQGQYEEKLKEALAQIERLSALAA